MNYRDNMRLYYERIDSLFKPEFSSYKIHKLT